MVYYHPRNGGLPRQKGSSKLVANRREFNVIWKEAHAAGFEAADKHTPTPMIVVDRANPLDDSSPIIRQYAPVAGGLCGFAWVNIKPGNSAFANWAKEYKGVRKDSYYGGVTHWVSQYGQSHGKKAAYAQAFAEVLRKHGINAYAMDRLD